MRFFILPLFLFSFSVGAKKFSTSYVSFDVLDNWRCYPEGTEWICADKSKKKAIEATIILTAKQKGPMDSLSQYMTYLKSQRQVTSKRRGTFTSKVFHVKQREINKHLWVDGFHESSEVKSYYTRYLVTTNKSLAILVTYSAHKDHYKKYASDFASSINSLKVKEVPAGFSVGGGTNAFGEGGLKNYILDQTAVGDAENLDGDSEEGSSSLFAKPELVGGLALLLALAGYFILKKRKRKNKGDKKDSSSSEPSSEQERKRDRYRKRRRLERERKHLRSSSRHRDD